MIAASVAALMALGLITSCGSTPSATSSGSTAASESAATDTPSTTAAPQGNGFASWRETVVERPVPVEAGSATEDGTDAGTTEADAESEVETSTAESPETEDAVEPGRPRAEG